MIHPDLNIIVASAFQPLMFEAHSIADWQFEWRERLGEDSLIAGESDEFVVLGHADFSCKTIRMSGSEARRSTEYAVKQTMLHEIAHARVGPRCGHGPTWQRMAREIGCMSDFVWEHGRHSYVSFPGRPGRGIRLDTQF